MDKFFPKIKVWKPEELENINDQDFLINLEKYTQLFSKYMADYEQTRLYFHWVAGDFNELTEQQAEALQKKLGQPPGTSTQYVALKRIIYEVRKITEILILFTNIFEEVNKLRYFLMYRLPQFQNQYLVELARAEGRLPKIPRKQLFKISKIVLDKMKALDPAKASDLQKCASIVGPLIQGEYRLYKRELLYLMYKWRGEPDTAEFWLEATALDVRTDEKSHKKKQPEGDRERQIKENPTASPNLSAK